MRALVHDPLVALVLRGALALLFTSAAWHKLADLARFRASLAAYRLLPASLVGPAVPVLAAAELAVAGALVLPSAGPMVGALGAAALLLVYAAAIAVNLGRGRRTIDCGCGGPGGRQPISEWLVGRNLLLIAAALGTAAPATPRPLLWIDWLALAGMLAVSACAWSAAHGLAAAAARVPSVDRLRTRGSGGGETWT